LEEAAFRSRDTAARQRGRKSVVAYPVQYYIN